MKTVILAGGYGTRLSEYTEEIPKPMVKIGDKPILWHVMSCYANYGYKDFIVALGYKGEKIKEYFLNYKILSDDFTINLATGQVTTITNNNDKDWNITLVDTGVSSMTGGRIKRLKSFLGDEDFMLTYGDGLANVNIYKLLETHSKNKSLVTLSAVRPPARFGNLETSREGLVKSFTEKSQLKTGFINGGFFVMNPKFIDYIEDDNTVLEGKPLELAANKKEVSFYKHEDFWQCMDTKRDKDYLESLISENEFPWLTK